MGATMTKNGAHFLDIPTQGTLHVAMLGLDLAGKTTTLYNLKFDQYMNTVPTIGFNCEKVVGTVGKAKGVQFLIWDVGGQEKLRPLWRSYTRCTDGILFVVDSVDVERMEEAKMELMRTVKCPDNQGVPVLILANKQDLPAAREPKELEKLLGLYELVYPSIALATGCSSASTGNIVGSSSNSNNSSSNCTRTQSLTPTAQHNKSFAHETPDDCSSSDSKQQHAIAAGSAGSGGMQQYKGWYIQPACAITGEGLQEGLEALYDMVLKRRKLNKAFKRKR